MAHSEMNKENCVGNCGELGLPNSCKFVGSVVVNQRTCKFHRKLYKILFNPALNLVLIVFNAIFLALLQRRGIFI